MLAQFAFTTSKGERDYYHLRMHELPHDLPDDLREISKFQENPWNAWNWWQVPNSPPKTQILTVVFQNCEKSAEDHFIKKSCFTWFCRLVRNISLMIVKILRNAVRWERKNTLVKELHGFLFSFKILFSYVGSRSVMIWYDFLQTPRVPAHKTKAAVFFLFPFQLGRWDSNLFSDMLHGSNND